MGTRQTMPPTNGGKPRAMGNSTGNRQDDDRSHRGGRAGGELEEITLHGHRVTFRRAGWGPAILLIHGIAGSSETWEPVIGSLAEKHAVIAPGLIGQGDPGKPRGRYSHGGYASGIRALRQEIGHDRAT